MCITSTGRRRSLTVQVLPSHLLASSVAKPAADSATKSAAATGPKNRFYLQQGYVQSAAAAPHGPATIPHTASSHYQHPHIHLHHEPSHSHVVQHDYHDHSTDPVVDPTKIKHKAKGGVITPFPVKLHEMLDRIEADGLGHVVSWQPHGRCFVVHKPKEFVNHVMPKYFKQTKMASFQRQLNLYGFNRLTSGLDKGGYYHELFLRGKNSLSYDIQRMRVKGTGVRLPTNPDNEPNFYALPPVKVTHGEDPVAHTSSAAAVSSSEASKSVKKSSPIPATMKLECFNHSKKVSLTTTASSPAKQTSEAKKTKDANDIIFFEGCPFHYLDPSALAPVSSNFELPLPLSAPSSPAAATDKRPKLVHSTSTVVSDSEEDDCSDPFIPSFSAANMDWEGPLSSPTIQAHMRRSSFQSFSVQQQACVPKKQLDDDVETFFTSFDMPVDRYHDQIEHMSEDDDTAFGYLLEQAISE